MLLFRFQILIILSSELTANNYPLLENLTSIIPSECPSNLDGSFSLDTYPFHNATVSSNNPAAVYS